MDAAGKLPGNYGARDFGKRHQADDGATPIYAACSGPIRICDNGVEGARKWNRAIGRSPVDPLIHGLAGGADCLIEIGALGATAGKIRKMYTPDALWFGHENRDVVEHGPTPFSEHNRYG